LLEGLEASVLKSNVYLKDNFDYRLDAEYFLKQNLSLLKQIEKNAFAVIGDFAYVTDGIHTSIDYCENSNVNLFSATTPRENYFDLNRQVFISEKAHITNPRTALLNNDIIISTVGTIGNCAVVDETVLPANSDRHVGIIRLLNQDFLPRYVSTFLLTKFGRFQTWRESTGNVQLNLFLYRIRTLKIAKLQFEYQCEIERLVVQANLNIERSKAVYTQAESLLFKTLGMSDFAPSNESVNIKSFKDSFASSGRLDAEHYQFKYDQLLESFDATGYEIVNIDAIVFEMLNGAEVREYQDDGVPYLRIGDLKYLDIDPDTVVCIDPQSAEKGLNKIELLTGDVLLSRSGSLAVSAVVDSNWTHALISSHLIRLRLRDNRFDPYFFALFLSIAPGKMQIQQWSNGGVQPEINQPALKGIYVPVVPKNTQLQIRKLILKAKELRNESKRLLEVAKRAVEMAIEKDEAAGMAFLRANL
jgi:Type I restriction modification DNA specificity domain